MKRRRFAVFRPESIQAYGRAVISQVDSLHRHTLAIVRLRIRSNINNAPADNTSASLGCSIFSEHYDASCPARMMYAVRYQCSACSVVCQRGVAQTCRILQHSFLRTIGLAMLREPEKLHHSNIVCIPALVSFRKTTPVRSLDADETFLVLRPFRKWSRAFVHHPDQVLIPI